MIISWDIIIIYFISFVRPFLLKILKQANSTWMRMHIYIIMSFYLHLFKVHRTSQSWIFTHTTAVVFINGEKTRSDSAANMTIYNGLVVI